ncbi:hypothetical protein [Mycobacterium sp.]|uniref:hypothetical protein n=1 Tax=Mycobacterium sp. TaxID=1785 RepID=UPI0031DD35EE
MIAIATAPASAVAANPRERIQPGGTEVAVMLRVAETMPLPSLLCDAIIGQAVYEWDDFSVTGSQLARQAEGVQGWLDVAAFIVGGDGDALLTSSANWRLRWWA